MPLTDELTQVKASTSKRTKNYQISMILTGPAILAAVKRGDIQIEPFKPGNLNPNSYNYHLSEKLLLPLNRGNRRQCFTIPSEGFVLQPGNVYLGATLERMGSPKFACLLLGRSSIGRLGIFLNVTADLGHVGTSAHWTLELTTVQPVRVYPHMKIGQISFWATDHEAADRYRGRYHLDTEPVPNRDPRVVFAHK